MNYQFVLENDLGATARLEAAMEKPRPESTALTDANDSVLGRNLYFIYAAESGKDGGFSGKRVTRRGLEEKDRFERKPARENTISRRVSR